MRRFSWLPDRERLLPGWAVTAGLGTALCAAILDLALSLWLQPAAGLRSATTVLLVLAVTFTVTFAAFFAGFLIPRLPRRPLALALAAAALAAVALGGVARSLSAGPAAAFWRQGLVLAALAGAVALLVYLSLRSRPDLLARSRLWSRLAVAAPLAGGELLLALWLARFHLPSAGLWLPVVTTATAGLSLLAVLRLRSPRTARRWLASAAVVALAGPWIAAWGADPDSGQSLRRTPPRRVILVSIDTLRADALSCYGRPGTHTPHLDRIADGAVRFTRAYSSASWTLPSMASLMSGLSPGIHRAVHSHSRVPDGVLTLAEVLRRDGYRTAALVSSTILGPAANLTQGFDEYTAFPGPWIGQSFGAGVLAALARPFRAEEAAPPAMAELAAAWLRTHRDGDFFLWVHFFDPHPPLGPPREYLDGAAPPPGAGWRFEGWDEDAVRAGTLVPTPAQRDWIGRLYRGEVRYVDDAVGRLTAELQRLGMYDGALIVVVSDHGEELWEHGAYGHGHTLYDELLHVPLLVKLPHARSGGTVDLPVSTASVAPTVLALSGVPFPAGHPATAALPLTAAAADRAEPLLSLGLNRYEDRRAVRFDGFKYVRWDQSGREELYDLAADPQESRNLLLAAAPRPAQLAAGRRLLAALDAQNQEARRLLRLGNGEEAALDDGTLARLRALGYVR